MTLSVPSILRSPSSGNLEETWFRIIEEYTARQLTYPAADKLAAISAISTRMGDAMDDTYISGHFLKTLPRSLLWSVRRGVMTSYLKDRAHNRLPKYSGQIVNNVWIITPSWSWASMDARLDVRIYQSNRSSVAAMEGYKFSTVGQRGPEAQVAKELLLTIRTWCHIIGYRSGEPEIDDIQGMFIYMDDMDDVPEDGSRYLLAALTDIDAVVEGLVLREIDFNHERVYERVGHFMWFSLGAAKVEHGNWRMFFTHGERSITLC
jgi:hypothetical protein